MTRKTISASLALVAHFLLSTTTFAQTNEDAKAGIVNKKLMLYIVENLFNKGDTAVANAYFVPEFAAEEKAFTKQIRSAFPDLLITTDLLVAENDVVAARWIASGTHKGVFLGLNPTNKKVTWKGSWFWTFKDGIVIDGMGKGSWDALGLLKQLQSK